MLMGGELVFKKTKLKTNNMKKIIYRILALFIGLLCVLLLLTSPLTYFFYWIATGRDTQNDIGDFALKIQDKYELK